jgi:hypothetical protein
VASGGGGGVVPREEQRVGRRRPHLRGELLDAPGAAELQMDVGGPRETRHRPLPSLLLARDAPGASCPLLAQSRARHASGWTRRHALGSHPLAGTPVPPVPDIPSAPALIAPARFSRTKCRKHIRPRELREGVAVPGGSGRIFSPLLYQLSYLAALHHPDDPPPPPERTGECKRPPHPMEQDAGITSNSPHRPVPPAPSSSGSPAHTASAGTASPAPAPPGARSRSACSPTQTTP